MTHCEFIYVDLWLGQRNPDAGPLTGVYETIQRLGDEGWEPVCQVDFEFNRASGSGYSPTTISQLMLKRARS